ncbi:type II toxin-antitoxin system VapC family toxin [Spirosoma rhododendri]|uniref:Type II toxin-antitoxin system VapC family toxin n=1 Tax=Spirosoma rhododendri TaxID=2728024 RepID=A0A7L5DWV6_9BACT|nr:type II toxin-antitoxin system VapC family toxin [Spirosoma rhododendri]QJD81138.1 type II toxin-antitoxin system VapC family toxin [Spirosoma rhododendri]
MNLLFDTNILLYLARDTSGYKILQAINPDNRNIHVSFASIAEVESIAFQQNWSQDRRHRLEMALDEAQIVEMSQTFLKTYIHIDAYSQRKHLNFPKVPFITPRNMGKHDLWIAATASLLGLTLVTTDADFDHLHGPFLDLRFVAPASLRSLMN